MRMQSHLHAVRSSILLRLLAATVLLLTASAGAQTRVVVSIEPYREAVQRIAGDEAVVDVLLPPGASPHAFDPTPRDVARLAGADLIVVNGGLDGWALELVEALGDDANVFYALDAVDSDGLLEGGHDHDSEADHDEADHGDDEHLDDEHLDDEHLDEEHQEEEHQEEEDHEAEHLDEGDHDDANPHVWLDPMRMRTIVLALADELARLDPAGAAEIQDRAAAYASELTALDAELRELLAPLAGAAFVPFHDAWPYFAERYDLDLVLEIEPFPGREPSARDLADALEAVAETGARAIFSEAQLSDRPARVLADEAGVRLGVLDPLGGVEGRRGYLEMLRYNAAQIVDALASEPDDASP